MTHADLPTLVTCLNQCGIVHTVTHLTHPYAFVPTVAPEAVWCLTLGQSHLYFDVAQTFLGTLTDETLDWEPRGKGQRKG